MRHPRGPGDLPDILYRALVIPGPGHHFPEGRARSCLHDWILSALMIPAPSLIVRIWLTSTSANFSFFQVVGHFTSIRSIVFAWPTPKCRRRSLCDMTLPPVRTRTRAPTAVRLQWVPISLILIQLFLLPPMLRRSEGGSFIFNTSTSIPPSLSKSPKAAPRLE